MQKYPNIWACILIRSFLLVQSGQIVNKYHFSKFVWINHSTMGELVLQIRFSFEANTLKIRLPQLIIFWTLSCNKSVKSALTLEHQNLFLKATQLSNHQCSTINFEIFKHLKIIPSRKSYFHIFIVQRKAAVQNKFYIVPDMMLKHFDFWYLVLVKSP